MRFFHPLQPQTLFYLTAQELVAYVEATVPRDKILVLVGGSSYFRGTGQNPDELWSHELQRLLGDRYAVVNYAIDQAGISAFAGVVHQILSPRYPRIVYVSSGTPFYNDPLDGGETYRHLYWDAYYKGMLKHDPVWQERVQREIARELRTDAGKELHLGKRLDAVTYACDLWQWIGYHWLFTVWSDYYPAHPFRPRGKYVEFDDPSIAEAQRRNRDDTEARKRHEANNLWFARVGYVEKSDGQWELEPQTKVQITERYDRFLLPAVRSRTLIVLLYGNPFFQQSLTAADHARVRSTVQLTQDIAEGLGYQAVQAGADFPPEDFVDAGHFMASGGRKIARIVAEKIQSMKL
ncbi:MAG: hypothetical protein HZA31_08870 [Opitutae bacterium]|nr:hypothetical protein [Opitutae bacterium]